jgi:hypothetical protein
MFHGIDQGARSEFDGVDRLNGEGNAMRILGASVLNSVDIGTHAIEYGVSNWPILPLNGKLPAIPNPHPRGSSQRRDCHGECGLHGHGVHDATADAQVIASWWGGRFAGCNIGGRVPDSMFVLDMDPRNGGLESLADLERKHGTLPETLTTVSGRGDGGCHRFYRRPPGKLSCKQLGPGIDLKTSTGYVVLAPSIHPETGRPYTRIDAPVAAPPNWLRALMAFEQSTKWGKVRRSLPGHWSAAASIADRFSAITSWMEILSPHGWQCFCSDPDGDGARWLHPTHTSSCSATIRNGCLFVYSSNTVFDTTESGYPRGYTKFRAFAVLNYGGDLSAAASALSGRVVKR